MFKTYFYSLLKRYLNVFAFTSQSVMEIARRNDEDSILDGARVVGFDTLTDCSPNKDGSIIVRDANYCRDLLKLFKTLRRKCEDDTRVVVLFYSHLWKPLIGLATLLGIRRRLPAKNWLVREDVINLLMLSDFECVVSQRRILFPVKIPILSDLVNRYLSPLPILRHFNMVNIVVARPTKTNIGSDSVLPSVSVVVPARNESGNIEKIIQTIPRMGPNDELVFVEGGSSDDTWEEINRMASKYKESKNIVVARQDGIGKGDAVRKGFSMATKEIFMIYDADRTVPADDLPHFYHAIISGKGEFINGCRLIYPMEEQAMRFCNLIGNKFFALAFTFVLEQSFKDTLCGTKVISRENYRRLMAQRDYFGDFDPFGDFDLIFGVVRLGLKIVELPIRYGERTYGDTNISRWSHGLILFRMLLFAAGKLKFV